MRDIIVVLFFTLLFSIWAVMEMRKQRDFWQEQFCVEADFRFDICEKWDWRYNLE